MAQNNREALFTRSLEDESRRLKAALKQHRAREAAAEQRIADSKAVARRQLVAQEQKLAEAGTTITVLEKEVGVLCHVEPSTKMCAVCSTHLGKQHLS